MEIEEIEIKTVQDVIDNDIFNKLEDLPLVLNGLLVKFVESDDTAIYYQHEFSDKTFYTFRVDRSVDEKVFNNELYHRILCMCREVKHLEAIIKKNSKDVEIANQFQIKYSLDNRVMFNTWEREYFRYLDKGHGNHETNDAVISADELIKCIKNRFVISTLA